MQIPTNPVSGVTVYWDIDKVFTTTNANGEFFFNNITPRNGYLRFEKTGFVTESIPVSWDFSNAINIIKQLNACPQMDSLLVYTVLTKRQGDIEPLAELVIKARINDPDNDIDSVYIKNDHLKLKKNLKYNINDRLYQESVTFTDLPSLQKAIGHDFDVFVKDKFSHTILMGSEKAVRIITDNFTLVYPASYQKVSPVVELKWKKFNPGYNFTWAIEIYADETPAFVIWEKDNIAANDTSCTVDIPLPDNDYFWMVWCIDEFQNRTRSKPVSFTVKE